jgi:hypothetical protein
MLYRVVLVRTDVSEERNDSIIRVTRTGEVGITLAVTINQRLLQRNTKKYYSIASQYVSVANVVLSSPILVTLMMEALLSSETSVLTRATQHTIQGDGILLNFCVSVAERERERDVCILSQMEN